MAISDKQKELDAYKWEKSQRLGFDACGSFDYCHHCDKANENPCEMAYNRFSGKETEIVVDEPKTAPTTPAKKSTSTKSTSKTTSKSTKSTSKKTTSKSTTKKTTTKKK